MLTRSDLSGLVEHLDSWTDAGLITADQADAIRAHEVAAATPELPRWVEPVAYLGSALVALALVLFGAQVWDQLATWSRIGLAALVTVILLLAGTALNRSDAAPARRAASFAWLLTVAGVAATAALVAFEALDLDEDAAITVTASCTLLAALVLYLLAHTALQQVGLAVGAVFFLVSLGSLLTADEPWMFSLALFALGAIWLLLTWGQFLRPEGTGWVLGGLLALGVGFGVAGEQPIWSGVGIAVGLGLVYLSTVIDLRALLVIGVAGLVVWIPTTVITLFEGSVVVPVAILLTGVVTLTVVVAAVRLGRPASAGEEAGSSDVPVQDEETVDA